MLKKIIFIIILVILFCAAIYFGYLFFSVQNQIEQEKKTYQELSNLVFPESEGDMNDIEVNHHIFEIDSRRKDNLLEPKRELQKRDSYDYSVLEDINGECVGWIRIDDTTIDYPVMWKPNDNTYYLNHDIYGNYTYQGTPFLDASYSPSGHLIIYGHNTGGGHTFRPLTKYQNIDFWQGHRYITLYLQETKHVFEVFATCNISATYEAEFFQVPINLYLNEFQEYIAAVRQKSLYQTGIFVGDNDRILLLSTCEYSQNNGRCVVFAHEVNIE